MECYMDNELLKYLHLHGPVRAKQVLARVVPDDVSNMEYRFLRDLKLTPAERRYLASVASVYSTSQMKTIKQNQYRALLRKQLKLGFASAADYEKYMRYLEGPRVTSSGSLAQGGTTKNKHVDGLLSRRRAAQESKAIRREAQIGAPSPYDENQVKTAKGVDEKQRSRGWRFKGSKRRQEDAPAPRPQTAPACAPSGSTLGMGPAQGGAPKGIRQVWQEEQQEEPATRRNAATRKSEFAFLQVVTAEAEAAAERVNSSHQSGPLSVDSISSTGSSHSIVPRPPQKPREGYGRPRSRLGRTKPKYEDIEDEDQIPEDVDTNHDNSLLVVVESDTCGDDQAAIIETKGTQTGDEDEEPEIHKDMSTSIGDFEAYLKAHESKSGTVEKGTSMDEDRAARRERRRRRREQRTKQAEEHREQNLSVASLKFGEDDEHSMTQDDDQTSSIVSTATKSVSEMTVSTDAQGATVEGHTETVEAQITSDNLEKSTVESASTLIEVDNTSIEVMGAIIAAGTPTVEVEGNIDVANTSTVEDGVLKVEAQNKTDQAAISMVEAESKMPGAEATIVGTDTLHVESKVTNAEVHTDALEVQNATVAESSENQLTTEEITIEQTNPSIVIQTLVNEDVASEEQVTHQRLEPEMSHEPEMSQTAEERTQLSTATFKMDGTMANGSTVSLSSEQQQATPQPVDDIRPTSPVYIQFSEHYNRDVSQVSLEDIEDDVSMDIRFEENPPDPVSSQGDIDFSLPSPPTPEPFKSEGNHFVTFNVNQIVEIHESIVSPFVESSVEDVFIEQNEEETRVSETITTAVAEQVELIEAKLDITNDTTSVTIAEEKVEQSETKTEMVSEEAIDKPLGDLGSQIPIDLKTEIEQFELNEPKEEISTPVMASAEVDVTIVDKLSAVVGNNVKTESGPIHVEKIEDVPMISTNVVIVPDSSLPSEVSKKLEEVESEIAAIHAKVKACEINVHTSDTTDEQCMVNNHVTGTVSERTTIHGVNAETNPAAEASESCEAIAEYSEITIGPCLITSDLTETMSAESLIQEKKEAINIGDKVDQSEAKTIGMEFESNYQTATAQPYKDRVDSSEVTAETSEVNNDSTEVTAQIPEANMESSEVTFDMNEDSMTAHKVTAERGEAKVGLACEVTDTTTEIESNEASAENPESVSTANGFAEINAESSKIRSVSTEAIKNEYEIPRDNSEGIDEMRADKVESIEPAAVVIDINVVSSEVTAEPSEITDKSSEVSAKADEVNTKSIEKTAVTTEFPGDSKPKTTDSTETIAATGEVVAQSIEVTAETSEVRMKSSELQILTNEVIVESLVEPSVAAHAVTHPILEKKGSLNLPEDAGGDSTFEGELKVRSSTNDDIESTIVVGTRLGKHQLTRQPSIKVNSPEGGIIVELVSHVPDLIGAKQDSSLLAEIREATAEASKIESNMVMAANSEVTPEIEVISKVRQIDTKVTIQDSEVQFGNELKIESTEDKIQGEFNPKHTAFIIESEVPSKVNENTEVRVQNSQVQDRGSEVTVENEVTTEKSDENIESSMNVDVQTSDLMVETRELTVKLSKVGPETKEVDTDSSDKTVVAKEIEVKSAEVKNGASGNRIESSAVNNEFSEAGISEVMRSMEVISGKTTKVKIEPAKVMLEPTEEKNESSSEITEMNTELTVESGKVTEKGTEVRVESNQITAGSTVSEVESTDMTEESAESKVELTKVTGVCTKAKAESPIAAADTSEVNSESTEETAHTLEVKIESTGISQETTDSKSESTALAAKHAEVTVESPESTDKMLKVKVESTEMTSESTEAKAISTEVRAKSSGGKIEPTELRAENTEDFVKSTEVRAEKVEGKIQSTAVTVDRTDVEAESPEVTLEVKGVSTEVPADSSMANMDPKQVDSSKISVEQSIVKSDAIVKNIMIQADKVEGSAGIETSKNEANEDQNIISQLKVESSDVSIESSGIIINDAAGMKVMETPTIIKTSTQLIDRQHVNTEAATQLTNGEQLNTEAATQLTNGEQVNTEAATQLTDGEQVNTEAATQLTNGKQLNTEAATQLTNGEQVNTEAVTQLTNEEQVNTEAATQLTNAEQVNTEAATQLTNGEQVNTEAATQLTNGEQVNTEAATQLTNAEQVNTEAATQLTNANELGGSVQGHTSHVPVIMSAALNNQARGSNIINKMAGKLPPLL